MRVGEKGEDKVTSLEGLGLLLELFDGEVWVDLIGCALEGSTGDRGTGGGIEVVKAVIGSETVVVVVVVVVVGGGALEETVGTPRGDVVVVTVVSTGGSQSWRSLELQLVDMVGE